MLLKMMALTDPTAKILWSYPLLKGIWDTSTSSEVSNCDGVMLEIYLDHKF